MTRFDGTKLLDQSNISLLAMGVTELDLCSNESMPAYGQILLESTTEKTFVAEVIRQSAEGSIEFGGPLKP